MAMSTDDFMRKFGSKPSASGQGTGAGKKSSGGLSTSDFMNSFSAKATEPVHHYADMRTEEKSRKPKLLDQILNALKSGVPDDAAEDAFGTVRPASEHGRVFNTMNAAGKSTTSGNLSALGFLLDSDESGEDAAQDAFGAASLPNLRTGKNTDAKTLSKEPEAVRRAREAASDWAYQKAGDFGKEAAESEARAKEGLGKFGTAAVDIGIAGTQMLGDVALNAVLPGAGLAAMGARSFGNATQEAREAGASMQEQFNYGMTRALADVLSEKLFDVGKLFGGGAADDIAERLIGKLAKSDTGRSLARALTNAAGEGAEEAIVDVLEPAIRAIYDNGEAAKKNYTTAEGAKEMLAQSAYDAMIGAALSTVGTAAGIVKGVDAQKNAALRAGEQPAGASAEVSTKPAEAENIAAEARADTAPVETAQGEGSQATVRALLKKGTISNSEAERIIKDAGLRAEFERQTGETLTGTKSDQRAQIKRAALMQDTTGEIAKSEEQAKNAAVDADPQQHTPEQQPHKTGEIVNERAENAVEAQNSNNFAGVQQREAEPDTTRRGTLPEGQGAMSPEFGYDEAKTQARSLKNMFEKGDRKKLGLTEQDLSHKVEHDAEAAAKAQERFDSDYLAEKADLFGEKRDWDKTDTALAYMIMESELDKAHKSGSMDDYAEVARLVKRWHEQGTDVGQVMQQRQALSKSPKLMEAAAIELLMDKKRTRKMTAETRKELLDAVTDNAKRLTGIPDGDTAQVISLIKDLSDIRKTNGMWFGDLERRMSKAMSSALERAANMDGGEAFLREIAATQIVNIARDYALPSHIERVKTWRYLCMLSKPATAARNIAGNNVMNVVDAASLNCGVPLDMLLSKYTGVRSTALDKSWFGGKMLKGANDSMIKTYIEIGLDADTSGSRSKMETTAGRTNKMTGNFFERLVSTFEKYSNYAMVATDEWQKGGIEAEARRGNRELERAGKINKGALDSRPEALAKERTFQNDSKTAQEMNGIRNALNAKRIKDKRGGSFGAGDLILPFTNVPGNVADTAFQYSPFGFIRAGSEISKVIGKIKGAQLTIAERESVQSKLERAYKRVKNGELTKEDHAALWRDVASVIKKSSGVELTPKQRDSLKKAVDQYLSHAQNGAKAQCDAAVSEMASLLAKAKAGALTAPEQAKAVADFGRAFNGSMGIAFFAVLAGAGLMKVAGDDDKDKEALERSEGVNGTQLNTSALVRLISGGNAEWQDGDTLVSIGFLDPINAQMTYGALLAECYEENGKITFGDVTRENLSSIFQSVMDLPAMSQLQEIENSYKYSKADSDGGKLADAALRYGASQATSFIPNFVSGIGQGVDGKVRDTYNADTTGENAWRAVKNKTIFLRHTNPVALDSWGNEKTYGDSAFQNFMNATLNPGSITKYRTDAVNQELYRLGESIDIKYPERKAPTSANRGGKSVTLTEAERRDYQTAYGKTAHTDIQKVINSAVYKQASDAEKAKAIENLLAVATAAGKRAASLDKSEVPSWTTKSDGSVSDNAVYYAKLDTAKATLSDDARGRNGDVMQAIIKTVLNKRGGSDQIALNVMSQQLSESTQGKVETAYGEGYSLQQIADFYQAKHAKGADGKKKYKKEELYAWAMRNGYTARQFNRLNKLFP